ncbi:MAG: hypothetical protein CMM58_01040 [Rhodospirillaceae bacterium]|nr:hypothetical protein [Rhodospirillaceae bacterium]|tara:strand:- start:158 stop:1129 length:972 start_codon:yes stop_codon:yes gene_type:complete
MNIHVSNNTASTIDNSDFLVATFYKFISLQRQDLLRKRLHDLCSNSGVLGTILLAPEGINGTIAGASKEIHLIFSWLQRQPRFYDLNVKYSTSPYLPFHRLKIRLKKEIVTMGQSKIAPGSSVGIYVKPNDWNNLIEAPGTILVDTRNDYEVEIGSFKNALNPHTTSFREFPTWVRSTLEKMPNTNKFSKIAMFCTGGIRCEKATSYMKQLGYREVYHLEGGILKYLEEVPKSESLWNGECFVFDQRVSVQQDLIPGNYQMCHACRMPLSENDIKSKQYLPGISCPKCAEKHTSNQKRRFRDRQKQMELAKIRGQQHLGSRFK